MVEGRRFEHVSVRRELLRARVSRSSCVCVAFYSILLFFSRALGSGRLLSTFSSVMTFLFCYATAVYLVRVVANSAASWKRNSIMGPLFKPTFRQEWLS